jgi:hypothetical protein
MIIASTRLNPHPKIDIDLLSTLLTPRDPWCTYVRTYDNRNTRVGQKDHRLDMQLLLFFFFLVCSQWVVNL